jgi:NAD(P)H dehydrogenase (quinone)
MFIEEGSDMSNQPTLLVTGASGQLGQRVLELLLETYTGPIVAATRTPAKLAHLGQRGVSVRPADFEDAASLAAAFAGVDRLLLISTDVFDGTDRRRKQHLAAVKAAEATGVSHVLYTSISRPEPETPVVAAHDHYATEQALAGSSLGWTFLRNNIYTEFQVGGLSRAVQAGQLVNAAGTGKTAYVSREDCARAAAAALASGVDGRRILDITGPEALSQADLAEIAANVSGRPVRYVPIDLETLIGGMVAAGVPRALAEGYASFDAGIALGKMDVVSSAVEDLTGRKPIRLADYMATQRDALLAVVTPESLS